MDKYIEYLLEQINYYKEMIKEDPEENHNLHNTVIDELLQALVQYYNFKVNPYIGGVDVES